MGPCFEFGLKPCQWVYEIRIPDSGPRLREHWNGRGYFDVEGLELKIHRGLMMKASITPFSNLRRLTFFPTSNEAQARLKFSHWIK